MKPMVVCILLLALIFMAVPGHASAPAAVTVPGRPEELVEAAREWGIDIRKYRV